MTTNLPSYPSPVPDDKDTAIEQDTKKRKVLPAVLLGAGVAAIVAGSALLYTNLNDSDDKTSAQSSTSVTSSHSNAKETTTVDNPDNPGNTNPNPQASSQNQDSAIPDPGKDAGITNELTEDQIKALDEAIANGSSVSIIKQKAESEASFGTEQQVDGLKVTVSNPREENGNFIVDIKVVNTMDEPAAFSGSYFVNSLSYGKEDIPDLFSAADLGTGPLLKDQEISGPLTFKMEKGIVSFVNPNTGNLVRWV